MYYQLTYRIQDSRNNFGLELDERIKQLDYNYVQLLSWTSGHFILESHDNNIIRTLVAYPHVVKPDRELILIQEYILDRLGLDYETTQLAKWIHNREDDIHDEDVLEPNNLIIRSYHQDYFFNRILEISLKEKSPRIASVFYSNYYLDSSNTHYMPIDQENYDDIKIDECSLTHRFERAYSKLDKNLLPIFIINEPYKLKFEFLKDLLINQIKKDYQLELESIIFTIINQNSIFSEIEIINSPQLLNNILGQIWEITIDVQLISYQIIQKNLKDYLTPVISSNRFHTLIIIRNPKYINLIDSLDYNSYINI